MGILRRDLVELIRLATPVVGTRLGVMVMGLTDTVVVGRHSATELGYMALGWAPTAVVLTTAMGLLAGVQVLTARRAGEGRPEATGAVLRRGVVYAFWLGVASSLALIAFGPALLRLSGVDPDLAEGAGRALRIFSLSLTASLLGVVLSSWLEALGRPGRAMAAMWLANGVNLAFDLVLVPGGFGLPALGAVGAGWSTFGARLFLLLALAAFVLRLPDVRALGVCARPPRDRAAEAEQRRIGYAAGAAFFVETTAFSGMNIVAGWVGGLAVAGWAIALNVAALIFMAPLGIAAAASVLVGRAYGAGDWTGVARAGKLSFGLTTALLAVVSLAVWLQAKGIARLYTTDPALVALTAAALVLACLFFIADGLQVVTSQVLRACGDVWLPTYVQIASYAAVMLPLGWALAVPAGLGLSGIVWAVIVASLMSAGLLLARFAWVARPA
jgi:MATE family multidrug resistance protein